MRVLVERVTIARARAIAAEMGLLGPEFRRAEPAALKKAVADADQLARRIADALDATSRQQSALKTLARVAHEATDSATLDKRGQDALRQATKALGEGDFERYKNRLRLLSELHAEMPDPLLQWAEAIVGLGSRDLERVLASLELASGAALGPPREPRAPALRERAREQPRAGTDSAHRALTGAREAFNAVQATIRSHLEPPPLPQTLRDALSTLSKERASPVGLPAAHDNRGLAILISQLASEAERTRSVIGLLTRELGASLESRRAEAQRIASAVRIAGPPPEATIDDVESWFADSPKALDELNKRWIAACDAIESHPDFRARPDIAASLYSIDPKQGLALALESMEAIPRAAPPAAPAPPAAGIPLVLSGFRALPQFPISKTWAVKLKVEATPVMRRPEEPLLPIAAPVDAFESSLLPGNAAASEQATAWARDLLRYLAHLHKEGQPLAPSLKLLADARLLYEGAGPDRGRAAFGLTVTALTLHGCDPDRSSARSRRVVSRLLQASEPDALLSAAIDCVREVSRAPALTCAVGALLGHGFGESLCELLGNVAGREVVSARGLAEAFANAAAARGLDESRGLVTYALARLGLTDPHGAEEALDYLDDCETASRKRTEPRLPALRCLPTGVDLLVAFGGRLRERGRPGAGAAAQNRGPRPSVFLPEAVEKEGIAYRKGARSVDIPLIVRNGGEIGAGGISVLARRPDHDGAPLLSSVFELHVPWLSDSGLGETCSVVAACSLEVDPDEVGRYGRLKVKVDASWIGGSSDLRILEVPVVHDPPSEVLRPTGEYRITDEALGGEPLDLTVQANLEFSSASVRDCYAELRDRLVRGEPVRALIHGRRRRGKSSIVRSLETVARRSTDLLACRRAWNQPRMKSVAVAFGSLSAMLCEALREGDAQAEAFEVAEDTAAEICSRKFQVWLHETAKGIKSRTRVLLLIDEFQKWLSGLAIQERVALLGALRHFNEKALGQLEVSFVLSGLDSLREFSKASTDFEGAVKKYWVKEMTQDESNLYIQNRFSLDPPLDGRTRKRFIRLSGGNPFVLNRLGGNLLDLLKDRGRRWCTIADVDEVLAQPDSRLESYLRYVMCEDEEENAPALRQLTVLRAVASLLDKRDDYDGYVRLEEVEAWLTERRVEVEAGQPVEHLRGLERLGILESSEDARYQLPREWLCRQLARLTAERVELQPVRAQADRDLVLGRYRISKELRRGAQAAVFRAENVEGGTDVALKIYAGERNASWKTASEEAKNLKRVQHAYVVACHGAKFDERHGAVVIMEYVDGQSIDEILRADPQAFGPIAHVVDFLKKLAAAIAACHEANLVHKDLSHSNVLAMKVSGVWTPKLIDFGVAGLDSQPSGESRHLGTPGYVAPETGKTLQRTTAADIYSLGSLFVYILSGKDLSSPDFRLETALDDAQRRGATERLRRLIEQMQSVEPEKRPKAAELRGLLDTVLQAETWEGFHDQAMEALGGGRYGDAAALVGKALACVPPQEQCGAHYGQLLEDARTALLSVGERVLWWDQFLEQRVRFGCGNRLPEDEADALVEALKRFAELSGERSRVFQKLTSLFIGCSPAEGNAPLVQRLSIQSEVAARADFFEVLVDFGVADLVPLNSVEAYCCRACRICLAKGNDIPGADLWLMRVRRLGQNPGKSYSDAATAVSKARQTSAHHRVAPLDREGEPMLKIGRGELGHLEGGGPLKVFASRLFKRFPFIQALVRVEKADHVRVARPTLYNPSHLGRHLPQGTIPPENVLPLVVDASLTGDIPMRMNIELHRDTTDAQRDVALGQLRTAEDLLEYCED
ncbi:MAG: protein kinase domain-containing protein [Myxococcaceae bacterium]